MPNKKVSKKVVKKETLKAKVIPTKKIPFVKKKVEKKGVAGVTVGADFANPRLKSFSVTVVIPTQQFGNIQPKIDIEAVTIDQAVEFVKPYIEQLYRTYAAEFPAFMKEKVTVEEKHVDVPAPVPAAPKADTTKPEPAAQTNTWSPGKEKNESHPVATKSAPDLNAPKTDPEVKDEAYLKGEAAIAGAANLAALNIVEQKIKDSTKVKEEDKPFLITKVLKKRKEFE